MLKELEDYTWFPKEFRQWQMEFIGSLVTWLGICKPLVPEIKSILANNSVFAIQDTCSGTGLPAIQVHRSLNAGTTLLLTDKFPYRRGKPASGVLFSKYRVDVLTMQTDPGIFYTMFNAFHHFTEEEQKNMLFKWAQTKSPVLIAEILEPNFFTMIKIILTTTIVQLLTAPFIAPFSLKRLFFTYLVPINILTITYDGIVSVLKSKKLYQYQHLINSVEAEGYRYSVHKIKKITGNIIYIKGNAS
ncbi:MAG: hypothetical protein ACOYLO_17935 [Ferruginibacter sp.]